MQNGLTRLMARFVPAALVAIALCSSAGATIPDGFKDIKLGMQKGQVLDILQKGAGHSYDDLGEEIAEVIRNDELFRFATYRFNSEGLLIEIGLEMREILGRENVLERYGTQCGVKLSPLEPTVESDKSIEVKNNCLIIKKGAKPRARAAQGN